MGGGGRLGKLQTLSGSLLALLAEGPVWQRSRATELGRARGKAWAEGTAGDGWLLRAGAEAMQGLLATGRGGSLSWGGGALGRALSRVGPVLPKESGTLCSNMVA